MRSVMVALADVDNVWDSPDAHSLLNRDRTQRRDVVDDESTGGGANVVAAGTMA